MTTTTVEEYQVPEGYIFIKKERYEDLRYYARLLAEGFERVVPDERRRR